MSLKRARLGPKDSLDVFGNLKKNIRIMKKTERIAETGNDEYEGHGANRAEHVMTTSRAEELLGELAQRLLDESF